jgi:hypothetical protein
MDLDHAFSVYNLKKISLNVNWFVIIVDKSKQSGFWLADSIKPSLQFSCNFVVINASEGSLCFQIFYIQNYIN